MSGAAPLQAQPPASGGVPHSAVQRQADIPAVWALFRRMLSVFLFTPFPFRYIVKDAALAQLPIRRQLLQRDFYRAVQAYSG